MSDLSDSIRADSAQRPVKYIVMSAHEADEVAIAAGAAAPRYNKSHEFDREALASGIHKIDNAPLPYEDPVYLACLKAGGWAVVRVDGLTAWLTLGNGETLRVEATIGEDLTVYDALQNRDAPRTRPYGGWRSGGKFYRFHSPAAAARFADTIPPVGAQRRVGHGWALESYADYAHSVADRTAPELPQETTTLRAKAA